MKKLSAILILLAVLCAAFSAAALTPTLPPESENPAGQAETAAPETMTPAPDARPAQVHPAVTAEPPASLPQVETEAPPVDMLAYGMPPADEYLKQEWGVTTFRGSASRQNAACGTTGEPADRMKLCWDRLVVPAGEGSEQRFTWPGQPLIVKWSIQVREMTQFAPSYEPKPAMREVIAAEKDGTVHFLDLVAGEATRGPLKTGQGIASSIALHPSGFPLLCVSQTDEDGRGRMEAYNLYDLSRMQPFESRDGESGFVTAPAIDRTTDTLITTGMDGRLYRYVMRIDFDYRDATLRNDPQIPETSGSGGTSCLAPSSALKDDAWYADMSGMLRRVDTKMMRKVWEQDLGDAAVSAIALDHREEQTALYAANVLTRAEEGAATVYCLDAMSGEEVWHRDFRVEKQDGEPAPESGFVASPVIGRNKLDGLVFYTVSGLAQEERKALGLADAEASALIAMDKGTGETVWACGLEGPCYSSPVAVYDRDGGGRIIQCSQDGRIALLDGIRGTVLDTLQAEGGIEASPAVYKDTLVVASTGKDGAHVYGILLCSGPEENGEDKAP